MAHKINKLFFFVSFILLISFNCKSQPSKFDFTGRLVLYSNKVGIDYELLLMNVDKQQILKLPQFEEVEGSAFILFDNGKKILVNSYNSTGRIFVYNIMDKSKVNINTNSLTVNNVSMYNNDLYFSDQMSIYRYSMSDGNVIQKYTTDSLISDFAVYDTNLIAFNYGYYDLVKDRYELSNIYFFNFSKNKLDEIPFRALLYEWSYDRNYLLFNSGGLKILSFPSLSIQSLESVFEDSLKTFREARFIDNSEIIFAASKNKSFDETNLYSLDINTKFLKRITNTNSLKEIKSTFYPH